MQILKHLNQYDVIHRNVSMVYRASWWTERVVSYISRKDDCRRGILSGVLKRETESLPKYLSRINGATGKKFIVIIDE